MLQYWGWVVVVVSGLTQGVLKILFSQGNEFGHNLTAMVFALAGTCGNVENTNGFTEASTNNYCIHLGGPRCIR